MVSSQIRAIQEALKNDAPRFQFEGREIRLDARTGIFITMNPGCVRAPSRGLGSVRG